MEFFHRKWLMFYFLKAFPPLAGVLLLQQESCCRLSSLPRSRGFSSSMPFLRIRIFGSPPARGILPCLLFFMFSKPLARNASPGSAIMVLCLLSGPRAVGRPSPVRGATWVLMPRPSPPLMGFFHRKWLILYFLKAFPPSRESSLHCPIQKSWEEPSRHSRGFFCYSKLLPACPAFSLFAGFPAIRGCRHWAAARAPKTD